MLPFASTAPEYWSALLSSFLSVGRYLQRVERKPLEKRHVKFWLARSQREEKHREILLKVICFFFVFFFFVEKCTKGTLSFSGLLSSLKEFIFQKQLIVEESSAVRTGHVMDMVESMQSLEPARWMETMQLSTTNRGPCLSLH